MVARSLVKRANQWFRQNPECQPITCEVLEIDGAYNVNQHDGSVQDEDSGADWEPQVPAFLKVLRIWYRKIVPDDDSEPKPAEIDYINELPPRLESTPRAFGPKFSTLTDTIQTLNRRLLEDPDYIPGRILSIQTSLCRFSSKHCSVDPDRTFWMAENPEDMHLCYYFRIFFVRSCDCLVRYQLGMKDFAPNYSWKGKRKREVSSDPFCSLVTRADQWLETTSGLRVINCQTLDHHSYFRCARDSPGHELRALDNPHFRSSLSGLLHYTKVLRIYYLQKLDPESQNCVFTPNLSRKTFHIPACTCSSQVRLAKKNTNSHLPLEHKQVLHRLNSWTSLAACSLISVETVKVTTSELKPTYSLEETHFQSCGKGDTYSLYGIRLFVCQDPTQQRLPTDFSAEPKYIRVSDTNCEIL